MNLYNGKFIYLLCTGILLLFFLYKRDSVSNYETFESGEIVRMPELTENIDIDSKRLQTNQMRMDTFFEKFTKDFQVFVENKDYMADKNDPKSIDKKKEQEAGFAIVNLFHTSEKVGIELDDIEKNYDELSGSIYLGQKKQTLELKNKMTKEIGQFLLNGNGQSFDKMLEDIIQFIMEIQRSSSERDIKEYSKGIKGKKDGDLYDYSTNRFSVNNLRPKSSAGGLLERFKDLRATISNFIEIKHKDPKRNSNGEKRGNQDDENIKSVKFNLSGNKNPV